MADNDSVNTFAAKDNNAIRRMMLARTVEDECKYILPLLDSLPEDFTCCDAGCGPGSITITIAKRFPKARILAFDIDAESIELAKDLARQVGVDNVRFAVGNVLDFSSVASQPGFEALNAGCDVVHEHVTMMHTAQPLQMLREMRGAAKPGGWLACRDHDAELNMIFPLTRGVAYWNALATDMIRARGCDTQCARKMLHFALRAGFPRERVEVKAGDFSFATEKKARLWAESMRDLVRDPEVVDMLSKSVGYRVDAQLVLDGWAEWLEREDRWLSLFTMEMICQK